jgi:hypothetical protein
LVRELSRSQTRLKTSNREGLAGPAAGLVAGQFGYAAVYLLGAASCALGMAVVLSGRSRTA